MKTIFVIGLPGAGKTTVVTAALAMLGHEPDVRSDPIKHVRYGDVWHLGHHRQGFGGTDTLPLDVNPKACDWMTRLRLGAEDAPVGAVEVPRVIIGEGDRLANNAFFSTARAASTEGFTLIWLDCPRLEARNRMSIRARALAVPEQNASWWKGRTTKVNNLINGRPVIRLDATLPAEDLARQLYAYLKV